MADWLRRASEWIGLGPRETDRYDDYADDGEHDERVLSDPEDDQREPYRESEEEFEADRRRDAERSRSYRAAGSYSLGSDYGPAEGYVDPDEYAGDGGQPSEQTEVTELVPSRTSKPEPAREPAAEPDDEQDSAMEAAPQVADINRIIFISPKGYNEARSIGENYRDGFPVIMNLTFMEVDDARRMIDFASGLIFGTNGTIEKVESGIFLLCPENVQVTTADKQKIADGFYNRQ